jgi:glycosyltransferase involved in cell wall biosynthesis
MFFDDLAPQTVLPHSRPSHTRLRISASALWQYSSGGGGLEHRYDVLVEMDADLSHDPAALPDLIAATSHAHLVIGSRYVAGGSTPNWPWHRRQLSRYANRYAARMLGLTVKDTTGGLRAYRAELLRSLDLAASSKRWRW